MLDINKKPIFVFIGTLKHHVDCIAPCVGKLLEKEDLGYEIIYCDQTQIEETKKKLESYDKNEYQSIAFDVGFIDSTTKFQTLNHGIKPASFILGNGVPEIGDLGIIINIKGIYSGSLKSQQKKLKLNLHNTKIHKRVDKRIVETYIALKDILKLYQRKVG